MKAAWYEKIMSLVAFMTKEKSYRFEIFSIAFFDKCVFRRWGENPW